MARKSSKSREKALLNRVRSEKTPDLLKERERILDITKKPLPPKIVKKLEFIETVLAERGQILNTLDNVQ